MNNPLCSSIHLFTEHPRHGQVSAAGSTAVRTEEDERSRRLRTEDRTTEESHRQIHDGRERRILSTDTHTDATNTADHYI